MHTHSTATTDVAQTPNSISKTTDSISTPRSIGPDPETIETTERSACDRAPAMFDTGCTRRLVNLVDRNNQAMVDPYDG